MPTYVYKREDGSTFEIEQRITEAPLTTCPTTGQPVKRVITASAGLIFKGSGFYLTDYARNGGDDKKKTENTSTEKGSESKSSDAKATETKSAESTSSDSKPSDTKSSKAA